MAEPTEPQGAEKIEDVAIDFEKAKEIIDSFPSADVCRVMLGGEQTEEFKKTAIKLAESMRAMSNAWNNRSDAK